MKVLQVIARVGKMPIDDLSRLGVSNWIRSMLYFDHRQKKCPDSPSGRAREKGGAKSEAVIRGKKYKGGLVIEPKTGIHFNVSVLDFASLYPSIIKVNNISYETVYCPHEECKTNIIPEIGTWTCTKRKGIESLVVGLVARSAGRLLQAVNEKQDSVKGGQGTIPGSQPGSQSYSQCELRRPGF